MRRFLWPLIAIIWLGLLFYPWQGLPPLHRFLIFSRAPLQISFTADPQELDQSPYELKIGYDERGVPHIFGATEAAVSFGMGYVHARDRMFQLEMLRRTVRGRLSEVAGARALPSDQWWLKFNFEERARAAYAKMRTEEPALAQQMEAYAAGFNHFLKELNPAEKPLEYHLLGFEPRPMEDYTPIMLIRYMDKVLNYREDDLFYSALAERLPDSLIHHYYPWLSAYAFPTYPGQPQQPLAFDSLPATTKLLPQGDKLALAQNLSEEQLSVGSNNWAVSAKKSGTGNAFLCNDTHLGLALPGTWYEVHQVLNGRPCHGFSIPGSPFVVSGYTNEVAWGMTNATWDLVDFYRLQLNRDTTTYTLDGQQDSLLARHIEIPVKGAAPQAYTYYESYFGPLSEVQGEWVATQWVAEEFTSNEMRALRALRAAESVEEAYEALQSFGHPPQNFILADRAGKIGLVTAGYAMFQPQGPSRGIRAALRRSDKAEFRHQGRTIYSLSPERGWLHSANHHQVIDSLAPHLNARFAPTARGRRIAQVLSDSIRLDRQKLKELHGDVFDGEWPLLKKHMVATAPTGLRAFLKDWDGRMEEESVAATIYSLYKWRLRDSISALLIGDLDFKPAAEQLFFLINQQAAFPLPQGDSIDLPQLSSAIWSLVQSDLDSMGNSDTAWQYRHYHKISFRHVAGIEALSYPPFGARGGPRSVNVSTGLPGTHGPSMRTLIEFTSAGPVADLVLAGGQSGQPGHPHYDDQIDDWYELDYFRINWIKEPGNNTWESFINFKK